MTNDELDKRVDAMVEKVLELTDMVYDLEDKVDNLIDIFSNRELAVGKRKRVE
jgi:hypothetical protein